MSLNYKKVLKQIGLYYLATFGVIGIFTLLEKALDPGNSVINFLGALTTPVIAISGFWLIARLVWITARLDLSSRLQKKLLYFVAYILAFIPMAFGMVLIDQLFNSGTFIFLIYLLVFPILTYLTYREIYRNYCIYRFNKAFPNVEVQLENLSTTHIARMLTLNKIDPSYDVLSMTSKDISVTIKNIDAEKRRQAMQLLGSGFSLCFKTLTFGLEVLNKGSAASDGYSSSSYKSGHTMSAESDVKRLEQEVETRKQWVKELNMGIKMENSWEKGMYAQMLADAERDLSDAKKRLSRNLESDSYR